MGLASAGLAVCLIDWEAGEEMKTTAGTGDEIIFNGVAIAAGNYLCNDLDAGDDQLKGDFICLEAMDSTSWLVMTYAGADWGDCGP
jgi:hypothetical protein